MKWNRTSLNSAAVFGIFFILSSVAVFSESNSIIVWFFFFGSLGLFAMSILRLWQFRNNNPQTVPDKRELIVIEFRENSIYFPHGYYFRWSMVRPKIEISVNRIFEVNLNTSPPSFVLDQREVIFVSAIERDNLEDFAKTNDIPIVDRPEIWEMICEPFLDTTFDERHQKQTIANLESNGVSEKETLSIREKIGKRMLFVNCFVLDWTHIGQLDYLNWTLFMNKQKYWWSMEIALRNLKTEEKASH